MDINLKKEKINKNVKNTTKEIMNENGYKSHKRTLSNKTMKKGELSKIIEDIENDVTTF